MATDIKNSAAIFSILPKRAHPYAKLMRLDRPIGTWLLLLPGWWSIVLAAGGFAHMTKHHYFIMAMFAAGAVLMRGAGCVVNDIWDRDLDAKVERTRSRPLPAKQVKVRHAAIFLIILLLVSLGILLTFNRLTILLGFLSLLLVGIYPLMKRVTWWPQAFLGFTFNWGALMGWAAVTGSLDVPGGALHSPPLWIYLGGILWTLAYDTIYAHQDKEDDAIIGVKSTARLFGNRSKIFVGLFFALALVCFGVGKFFAAESHLTQLLIILPVAHAMWQLQSWNMNKADSSLAKFRSNRDFGLLMLILFGF
ncbi:MAG: 4-hydroxybenzoate polyprenyltransferase [Alphaproteobacteria bacterium]|jgi:4-hydroxybenzoate polyprenyltransferase|nr:4-hydroxybenzoate polyprenyltransferase [Alphaproteobacteria bacterium]